MKVFVVLCSLMIIVVGAKYELRNLVEARHAVCEAVKALHPGGSLDHLCLSDDSSTG